MTDQEQPQPEVAESELIRVRREKLARIVQLGYDAYPTKADTDTTIADVVAKFGDKSAADLEAEKPRVKIAGRIMTVREFGKTAFLVLSEKTARIQVYCRKDTLPERDIDGVLRVPVAMHEWRGRWVVLQHGLQIRIER